MMGGKVIKQIVVFFLVVILIAIVSTNNIIESFEKIKIENKKEINAPIKINFDDIEVSFTWWEGMLEISDYKGKLAGPKDRNQSYFFYEEDIKLIENNKVSWKNENKEIKEIGYEIVYPRFGNYLKINMFVKSNKSLERASYGFRLNTFDIFLPNGSILENDHLDENEYLIGTNHKNEVVYEIFSNNKDVIIIAGDFEYVWNYFKWEIFQPWISKQEDGIFSPLYMIYIKNAELKFEDGTWVVKSKQFTGKIEDYIEQIKNDLNNQ